MLYVALVAQALSILLLIRIAWHDVCNFQIRNRSVLILLGLYLPAQGFLGFPTWQSDLVAGLILFVLGFVMWMVRVLGAGDSKLMLPLGMHLGYVALMPFSILLFVFSTVLYIAITLSALAGAEHGLFGRLATMKRSRHVPYGLPLCVAAVPVMVLRFLWFASS